MVPYGVQTIANGVFSDCSSLKRVVLPDSVHTIGKAAFVGCEKSEETVIPETGRSFSWNPDSRPVEFGYKEQ